MTGAQSDTNFASAVMMRLIAIGLEKQGLGHLLKPARGAHVSRETKRHFLQRLSREHGLAAVLHLSDAVPDMPPEPVVQALKKATDMDDLLSRWLRVETFSHANHRMSVQSSEVGRWQLEHRSRCAGESPIVEESLLVIAVITRIGELTTKSELTLKTASGADLRQNGEWKMPVSREIGRSFLLSSDRSVAVGSVRETAEYQDVVGTVKAMMARDVARRWTIGDVARAMGCSTRSMQRKFSGSATTFSALVSEVRLEAAASYLCSKENRSLAEIGFLAGYSDQAHFSRSFVREVGTTPKAYQSNFAN